MSVSKLAKFEDYSDEQIYTALIEREPQMIVGCSMLAEMQVMMGYDDERILKCFRNNWPDEIKAMWDEDGEFRGKLILRAVHHVAMQLRARIKSQSN